MQTVQSTHVLAITSCFTTEALGVGAVLDGQVLLVENHVTIDVCHRHLSRRNEVEIIHLTMIHLTFLVGKLTCAITRSGIHNGWRHDFLVAGLLCLVEEEVNQSTLQSCTLASIDRETCSRNLDTKVEVDEIVLLSQFPMRKLSCLYNRICIPVANSIFAKNTFLEIGLHDPVVFGTSSFGHLVIWNVGNLAEKTSQFLLGSLLLVLQFLACFLEGGNLCLDLFCFFSLALLHEHANLGSQLLSG